MLAIMLLLYCDDINVNVYFAVQLSRQNLKSLLAVSVATCICRIMMSYRSYVHPV